MRLIDELTERNRYFQNKIKDFAEHFHPNCVAIESLNSILEDSTSTESVQKLIELGDGKPMLVNSNQFRELFIASSIQQYFPASTHSIDNYFDQITRMAWCEKQRKMMKEKKLHKFFGTKISSEQLQRQVHLARRPSNGFTERGGSKDPEGLEALLNQEGEMDVSDGNGVNRRKKMEKL
jgi:glutamate racemase